MKDKLVAVVSWVMALWASKVFLSSIPYKFSNHPDTRHIFTTIGEWMSGFLGNGVGNLFANFGPYAVGSFELLTSVVLLLPALIWLLSKFGVGGKTGARARIHRIGGLMAAVVMAGAVFFHLFTPLGIEVLHQGKSDGGSLFYAALSILICGTIMFFINAPSKK